MHPVLAPAVLFYLAVAAVVCNSAWFLYKAILAEKPEWLQYRGEPSIFYSGMPHVLDPNVNLRVLAVAFSRRASLLSAPEAWRHAKIIRGVLPTALLTFGFVLVYIFLQGAA